MWNVQGAIHTAKAASKDPVRQKEMEDFEAQLTAMAEESTGQVRNRCRNKDVQIKDEEHIGASEAATFSTTVTVKSESNHTTQDPVQGPIASVLVLKPVKTEDTLA